MRPSEDEITIIHQAEELREWVNIQRVMKEDQWGHVAEMKVLQRLLPGFLEYEDHLRNSCHVIDSHYTDVVRNLSGVFLKLIWFYVVNLINQLLASTDILYHVLGPPVLLRSRPIPVATSVCRLQHCPLWLNDASEWAFASWRIDSQRSVAPGISKKINTIIITIENMKNDNSKDNKKPTIRWDQAKRAPLN